MNLSIKKDEYSEKTKQVIFVLIITIVEVFLVILTIVIILNTEEHHSKKIEQCSSWCDNQNKLVCLSPTDF